MLAVGEAPLGAIDMEWIRQTPRQKLACYVMGGLWLLLLGDEWGAEGMFRWAIFKWEGLQ